jgi:phospholipase C
MPFQLEHLLFTDTLEPTTEVNGNEVSFHVDHRGEFEILYPGKIQTYLDATVVHHFRLPEVPDPPVPPLTIDGVPRVPRLPTTHLPKGGLQTIVEGIPLDLRIFTPFGEPFTAAEVTLADLRRFRDLRGRPQGKWTYTITGHRRYTLLMEAHETVSNPKGAIAMSVLETVPTESAPPLVFSTRLDGSRQTFTFDLYRVGTFVAEIAGGDHWKGGMRLMDPDGNVMGRTFETMLRVDIPLSALGRSRDRDRRPRLWTLHVSANGGVVVGSPTVSATVYGQGRISTGILHQRIQRMIGERGRFLRIFGKNSGDLTTSDTDWASARIVITDEAAAEAVDMHDLLAKRLKASDQDPGVDPKNVEANVEYVLWRHKEQLYGPLRLDVRSMNVERIDVSIGPGDRLGAETPAVKVHVEVSGEVAVKAGPVSLAHATVRDGRLDFEVGVRLGPDGIPKVVSWAPSKPFDIDVDLASLIALGLGAVALGEELESILNAKASAAIASLFDDEDMGPTLLMTIFGAHLTLTSIRFEGEDIVFEHIAPVEPEPKPHPDYAGAIGRAFDRGTGQLMFHPFRLGDTWASANLGKIDHIVAVMMENRSYDHVLGFRAMPTLNEASDGLTQGVIDAIQGTSEGHVVRNLQNADFAPNVLGHRTQLPNSVGHHLEDVDEQLSVRMPGPDGRQLNDPKGFVDNFNAVESRGVKPDDVLGYYTAPELPIYDYLARNYAYCDRYYCSHPGPTLPNRMFSLTGDVQYDRLGVPILNNNHGDNFLLSRAETIYDVLTKRGISWRVYESNPSVTMLRMFARYATNSADIVPLDQLENDVSNGDLPAFTYIEPAMHHHPQDDDHPDADMWRGQQFIYRVYQALRSNEAIWQKTLLIITYDEHGGFYDHVIPPIADILEPFTETGGVDVHPTMSEGDGDVGGGAADPGSGDDSGDRVPRGLGVGSERAREALGLGTRTDVGSGSGRELPGGVVTDSDVVREMLETSSGTGTVVPPRRVPVEIQYGVRVPTFVVSPWVSPGKGPSITLDHCSILKTVLARFAGPDRPFLSDRVHASQTFESFLAEAAPRSVPPPEEPGGLPLEVRRVAPDSSAIETPYLTRKQMRDGPVDSHDVMGRLARMLGR